MTNRVNDSNSANIEEPPPIMGTWKKLYALVFFNLVALIVLFSLFTAYFN